MWILSFVASSLAVAMAQDGPRPPPASAISSVLIEDLDDFAEWAFTQAGLSYNPKHEFNLRISSDEPIDREALQRDGHVTVLDEDDIRHYANPAASRYSSFLEVPPSQNPLQRDTDDLPSSPDSKGQDHSTGSLDFILVTTFDRGQGGSGEVWVVPPHHKSLSFVLIGGLQTPTGVCFDVNNRFLYVCDPAQGSIFQYEIDADQYRFVLQSSTVATVYRGAAPTSCVVDAYGNLYYTDLGTNSVGMVDYLNLWAGFADEGETLFDDKSTINVPMGIDVSGTDTVYWVNFVDTQNVGVLSRGPTRGGPSKVTLREDIQPLSLAIGHNLAYFSTADGDLWAYSLEKTPNLYLKLTGLKNPRGVCYGDGRIYVSEFDKNRVLSVNDGKTEEKEGKVYVRIRNPYSLACINH